MTQPDTRPHPLKWLDLPPVWLALCLVLAWAQARYVPAGLGFGGAVADLLGGLLVGGGILLMVLAFAEFRRHKTTVVPHLTPQRLIQTGIFSRTRNPIYLGDALVLAGLILRWDAVLALPLVPIFVWIIERRHIIPEENRMRRTFRAEFARYERNVRRWV
ncbi:MAG: isoprenylcysteine carboxylmethyltransferase family protein [Marinibacterium sp.]|nr:isoprenylcysteine carboxylmethyltransferase family protein [Marinibacterium sp.]